MAKVYLGTSVVIALANPEDRFNHASVKLIRALQAVGVSTIVALPILLEMAKAVQRRGVESSLTLLYAIDRYRIELAMLESDRLLNLVDRYIAYRVAGAKYRFDLLHYASATLLNCSHLAS